MYEYCNNLINRFKKADNRQLGLVFGTMAGSVLGPLAVRSFEKMVIPLLGSLSDFTPATKIALGLVGGAYYGAAFGQRIAETIDYYFPGNNIFDLRRLFCNVTESDVVEARESYNFQSAGPNKKFLMRLQPVLIAGLIAYLLTQRKAEGIEIPLFINSNDLQEIPGIGFSILSGLYYGSSAANRWGEVLDFFTNKTLIADLGLTRLASALPWISEKIKLHDHLAKISPRELSECCCSFFLNKNGTDEENRLIATNSAHY